MVRAELPGFEEKEIEVQFSENYLIIKAEKEDKTEENGYRMFNRTMLLPYAVDPNKVKAIYRNGVLELHIPKPEGAMLKRIPIRSE